MYVQFDSIPEKTQIIRPGDFHTLNHRAFEERTQIIHDKNSLIKASILRVVYKKTVSPAGIKFRTDLYGSVSGPTLLVFQLINCPSFY